MGLILRTSLCYPRVKETGLAMCISLIIYFLSSFDFSGEAITADTRLVFPEYVCHHQWRDRTIPLSCDKYVSSSLVMVLLAFQPRGKPRQPLTIHQCGASWNFHLSIEMDGGLQLPRNFLMFFSLYGRGEVTSNICDESS